MKLSRRGFLGLFAGGALIASSSSLRKFYNVADQIEVTHSLIKIPKLPSSFDSYRIAVFTDLHLGTLVPNELIEKAILLSNSYEPDLILLGGDYIGIPDSLPGTLFSDVRNQNFSGLDYSKLVPAIYETLGALFKKAVAKDGIYSVLGNHDNWHNPNICCDILKTSPIKFLINEVLKIQRGNHIINLLGVDDLWTGVPRIPTEFFSHKDQVTRIILSHNPDFLVETIGRHGQVFTLGISGHTHGGQIKLPIIGPIIGYNIRYSAHGEGLTNIGNSHIYTSRGLGVVDLPYRIGCPPELAILELQGI